MSGRRPDRRIYAALAVVGGLFAAGVLPALGGSALGITEPRPPAPAVAATVVPVADVAPTGDATPEYPEGPTDTDRVVGDARIAEGSGLTPSLVSPGVLWTLEDSDNPTRLFGIGQDGATAGVLTLRGTRNVDWEAVAAVRDSSRRPLIAIGDIGDNTASRRELAVILVREPSQLGNRQLRPAQTLRLRYPSGAVDAEALLADPRTNRLYIATKGLAGGALYAVPEAAWPGAGTAPGGVWTLEKVADLQMSMVTDGAFLPDGRMVLRSYSSIAVFPAPAGATGVLRPVARAPIPGQELGEGLAVVNAGQAVLLGSEGQRQPILRVPVPGAPGSPAASEPAAGAEVTTEARSAPVAENRSTASSALRSIVVPALIGGFVLLALIFVVVLLVIR